jgi:hypothetical protein
MSLFDTRAAFTPRRLLAGALLLALSGLFLFSGYAKLISLETFGWSIRDAGVQSEGLARFAARTIVGLEILLGLFLLFRVALRRFTLPATIGLLVLFCVYLFYLVAQNGWDGDCGCYGSLYSMSPGWALVRNGAMIGGGLLLYALPRFKTNRTTTILGGVGVAIAIALPIIFSEKEQKPSAINLAPVYSHGAPRPATNLMQGRHLIAFFSLTCPHCMTAAKTLGDIWRQDSTLPITMVLGGKEKRLQKFLDGTNSGTVPFTHVQPMDSFIRMAGPYVPAIFFVENGKVVRSLRYTGLTRSAIAHWVRP